MKVIVGLYTCISTLTTFIIISTLITCRQWLSNIRILCSVIFYLSIENILVTCLSTLITFIIVSTLTCIRCRQCLSNMGILYCYFLFIYWTYFWLICCYSQQCSAVLLKNCCFWQCIEVLRAMCCSMQTVWYIA